MKHKFVTEQLRNFISTLPDLLNAIIVRYAN